MTIEDIRGPQIYMDIGHMTLQITYQTESLDFFPSSDTYWQTIVC